jgi:peptidoglycan/LPS O-acetylase OafA/YrhL
MIDFKYRPDVDGLRAVAVLLVLLFHAELGFSGGFIGVDVFFVISGFLITGLILKDQAAGRFSLERFWVRRIRRIIPAATTMVLAVLAAGLFLLLPGAFADLSQSAIAQQLMYSNVYFWKHTGYFDGAADLKPLLHTWSLAVEEQFYLGYPFVLVLLQRFGRRAMASMLACVALASLIASEYGLRHDPSGAFFLLPTRAWELLLGGLVCFLPAPTHAKRWVLAALSWLSLTALLAAGWCYSATTPFPGLAAMVPCLAAAILIYANSTRLSLPAQLLATKPLVFLGLLSYSLYLWHWPLLAFCRYWLGSDLKPAVGVSALGVSGLLAYASWRFIETPFRKQATNFSSKPVFLAAAASASLMVAIAYWIHANHGFIERLPEHLQMAARPIKRPQGMSVSIRGLEQGRVPLLGVERSPDQSPDFLVWGDSHAMALGMCLQGVARECQLSGAIAARSGTVPLLGVWKPLSGARAADAPQWNQAVIEFIRQTNVKNVIMVARWAVSLEEDPNGADDSLIALEGATTTDTALAKDAFRTGLTHTLDQLEALGVRVWVLKQVPLQRYSPQPALVRSLYMQTEIPKGVTLAEHRERQKNANSIIDNRTAGRSLVRTADLSTRFFDAGGWSCLGSSQGSFYRDDDHVSDLGANTFCRPVVAAILAEIRQAKAKDQRRSPETLTSSITISGS